LTLSNSPVGFKIFSFFGFFLRGIGPCGPVPPPPLEWISSPPLVPAVLITTKGDESPGSSRMGVIGALVLFSVRFRLKPDTSNSHEFELIDPPTRVLNYF